jgi:hypothetical protein
MHAQGKVVGCIYCALDIGLLPIEEVELGADIPQPVF